MDILDESKHPKIVNKVNKVNDDNNDDVVVKEVTSKNMNPKNEKHDKKVTLGQLKKIYRRGLGAFSSSHRPGQNRNSWAMARVNMFLKMQRGGKVKDAYRAADQDIARGEELYYEQKPEDCFWQFDSIDFDLARIDLVKAGVDIEEGVTLN